MIIGVLTEIFPVFCLIIIAAVPIIIKSGNKLRRSYDKLNQIIPIMSSTLVFSRITGILFVIGFLIPII
jgi:1,4-dihydroxy-2-naphthoate octaprenyltransferase